MKINTKFHGQIDIEQNQRWTFPQGVPGLEDEKEWVILPIDGEDVFQVLQSTMTPEIAFIVMNPYILAPTYELVLDAPTIELLEIDQQEDVLILAVVTLREPFNTSTWNAQAPLILNAKTKKGRQMITNNTNYLVQTPLSQGGE